MMLKVNDEFLDFNDVVEVEKRVKLFERIDETLGDFSYAFNLDKTSKNLKILGFPFPDVKDKRIYREVDCDLLDESGLTLYKGVLRVERVSKTIECSFFSGNYNWISLLSGQLSDLDLSDLDTDLASSEIINSGDNTEGIIFPIIDSGALITRSHVSLMPEDFSGMIFVKTLFKRIFQNAGVKINGDLFKDPVFDNLLLSRNTKAGDDNEIRSTFVKKTSDETFPDPSSQKILFQDDVNYPYFDGSKNLYNATTSTFIPDVKMRIRVDLSLIYYTNGVVPGEIGDYGISINGVFKKMGSFEPTTAVSNPTFPLLTAGTSILVTLNAGDTLEGFAEINAAGTLTTVDVKENSTFKVTPIFTYTTTGASLVPPWTQAQLVSNILSLFCCITDYEPVSKILTIDFLEGIKSKQEVDLSEHVSELTTDFSEFISSFGQKSLLKYQDGDINDIKQYNLQNAVNYGAGVIDVANDYIQPTADILETDFKSPISYINQVFGASLERMQYVDLEEGEEQEFTGVTNASDEARFAVVDATIYEVGALVRVSESTNAGYNGDYLVKHVGAGFIHLRGVPFNTDATGVITKLQHVVGNDDGVYLLINTIYRVDNVSQFSTQSQYFLGLDYDPNIAYAFFNMLNSGLPINDSYKQGLSFGSVNNPLSYQRSLVDTYWGQVGRVLNDPTEIRSVGLIPKIVFDRITPLRPIRIKTEQTNNLYYLNRVGGYKASYLPCEIDLIKLS